MIKRIFFPLIILFALVICCGCSEYLADSESISGGEILTPEYMAEISQQLVEDKNASSTALNSTDTSDDVGDTTDDLVEQSSSTSMPEVDITVIEDSGSEEEIVYWTESGSVWHKKKDCSSLTRSKNIISGSESDAISNGKERACKRCG